MRWLAILLVVAAPVFAADADPDALYRDLVPMLEKLPKKANAAE